MNNPKKAKKAKKAIFFILIVLVAANYDTFIDNTGREFKIDKKDLIKYLLGLKNE